MRDAARIGVVHLELHTRELGDACAFYAQLLGWRPRRLQRGAGSYLALELGRSLSGGMVECPTPRALWLPYVEVTDVDRATAAASSLGATVLLQPREGPAGWRSVVATRAGAELAFWQSKR